MWTFNIPFDSYDTIRSHDVSSAVIEADRRVSPNRPDSEHALLNHASLPYVRQRVHEACIQAEQKLAEAPVDERQRIADEVRVEAAKIIGVADPRGVIFAENTTTVNSIVAVLAGALENRRHDVVISNGEHISSVMALQMISDHSNTEQYLGVATTYDSWKPQKERPRRAIPTTLTEKYLNVFRKSEDEILGQIPKVVPKDRPCIVQFSHVQKETGNILPVKKITAAIKQHNSEAFVIVDGAQAVGNVPEVNAEDIGCDAYLYAAHKSGLRARPVGVAYMKDIDDSEIQRRMENIVDETNNVLSIHPETFHSSHNVEANMPVGEFATENLVGLSAALEDVENKGLMTDTGNFSEASDTLQRLRDALIERLQQMGDNITIDIVESPADEQSNAILSFRINDNEKHRLADGALGAQHLSLWRNMLHSIGRSLNIWQAWDIKWEQDLVLLLQKHHNIEMSYFAPRGLFRASFCDETQLEEIEHFVNGLERQMEAINKFLTSKKLKYIWRRTLLRMNQLRRDHLLGFAVISG